MPKLQSQNLNQCDDDIARLYLKTAAQQIARIGAEIRKNSMTEVQTLAHRLSGSSGFIGLKDMGKLLSDIEKAAERNDSHEALRCLSQAKEEFARIQSSQSSQATRGKAPQRVPPPPSKKRFKILVVDDHPLIQEGLMRLLNLQPDLVLCGQASTAHQALTLIPKHKPDLVILDITLSGSDGMGLIKDMKLRSLKSTILVLSMHDESLYAERTLKAGAKGYIMKHQPPKELLKAIHHVLNGEIYLSEVMKAKLLHKIVNPRSDATTTLEASLSDRELEVFQLIGQGRGTRDIAEQLSISVKTVESYRAHIKIKMNLANAHELTQHAVHWVESNQLN